MPTVKRKVFLCKSDYAAQACDKLPSNLGRQSMVDSLICAFGLDLKCHVIKITPASAKDLCSFHDEKYVTELLKYGINECSKNHEGVENVAKSQLHYGLAFDCPPFAGLSQYAQYAAGSSLAAANTLILHDIDISEKTPKFVHNESHIGDKSQENEEKSENSEFHATSTTDFSQGVAINWYGGRHHALKSRASGFCYVNDIVLAILKLRVRFKKIFYIDADLHHGDGVESAFRYSKFVYTFSVHRHDVGFFPGTGLRFEKGVYNVPTKKGLNDKNFARIFAEILSPLIMRFQPDLIVVQCGSDGLASDPNGEWNLTIKGLARSLSKLVDTFDKTHFLILGGGGYNHPEMARFCAYLTKLVVGDESNWMEIPEHSHIEEYEKDSFQFWTPQNTVGKPGRRDENDNIVESFENIVNL